MDWGKGDAVRAIVRTSKRTREPVWPIYIGDDADERLRRIGTAARDCGDETRRRRLLESKPAAVECLLKESRTE
jgi:hypothetical protein